MKLFGFLFGPEDATPTPAKAPSNAAEVMRCTDVLLIEACIRSDDGFLREAALARGAELGAIALAPAMVERLNDWVAQIRDTARSALTTLQTSMTGAQLLEILPATLALRDTGRSDHTAWIAQFELALVAKVDARDLLDGARGGDVTGARACFHVLSKYRLIDARALAAEFILSRTDIVLARQALALCATLPVDDRRNNYLAALASPFGAVRTLALRALLASQDDAKHDTLAAARLMDPQSSVREVAIAYLARRQFDVRSHYRALLDGETLSAKSTQIALMSLAGLHEPADVPRAMLLATSPLASVRRAAIVAWIRLAPHAKDEAALAALNDDRPSVRAISLRAVTLHGAYIPFPTVVEILEAKRDPGLLLSHAESGKWNWLEAIVRLAIETSADDALRPILDASLDDWAAKSGKRFDAPTAPQAALLCSHQTTAALGALCASKPAVHRVLTLELARIAGHTEHG
jgi:hypothetical protein